MIERMKGRSSPIGSGRPLVALILSLIVLANFALGRVVTTCTMGDDDGRVAAVFMSSPFFVGQTALLATMIGRSWANSLESAHGRIMIALIGAVAVSIAPFAVVDGLNVFFRGGSLCGSDYAGYGDPVRGKLVALYNLLVPIATLGLIGVILMRRSEVAEAKEI